MNLQKRVEQLSIHELNELVVILDLAFSGIDDESENTIELINDIEQTVISEYRKRHNISL